MKCLIAASLLVMSVSAYADYTESKTTTTTTKTESALKPNTQEVALANEKIKSCLNDIYTSQLAYHKMKGTYTPEGKEYSLQNIMNCNGMNITADYADKTKFKFRAQASGKSWSVDQSKTIKEVR